MLNLSIRAHTVGTSQSTHEPKNCLIFQCAIQNTEKHIYTHLGFDQKNTHSLIQCVSREGGRLCGERTAKKQTHITLARRIAAMQFHGFVPSQTRDNSILSKAEHSERTTPSQTDERQQHPKASKTSSKATTLCRESRQLHPKQAD